MTPYEHQQQQKLRVLNCYSNTNDCIQKSEEANGLEKGGEGSKGGKVIGHTKSGKPIYGTASNENHKDFTSEDHNEAAQIHRDKMIEHKKEGHKVHYHMGNRDNHVALAKKAEENKKD